MRKRKVNKSPCPYYVKMADFKKVECGVTPLYLCEFCDGRGTVDGMTVEYIKEVCAELDEGKIKGTNGGWGRSQKKAS